MKKILFAAMLGGALVGIASAGAINGSEPFSGELIQAGNPGCGTLGALNDITLATCFQTNDYHFSSPTGGTGDYAADTTTTVSASGPFIMDIGGGIGASSFTIADAGWGTFVATLLAEDIHSGTVDQPSVTLGFIGNFTPGTNQTCSGGCLPNTASLLVTLNQSGGPGNAISESVTLNTPASTFGTPEPGTMAMIGGALIGLASLRRKKA